MKFFNTLSGKLEEFTPLQEGEVRMYTCGPTVYDYAHIGNFRTFVFEDLLRRFLEFKGFRVKHVMNITDVDDKTIAGAAREGKSLSGFTENFTRAFFDDLRTLNIFEPRPSPDPLPPAGGEGKGEGGKTSCEFIVPRAAREIPAMIDLIEKLMKKGAAYASEGSVYYRVSAFPKYGRLSKKNLAKNIAGVRVDVDEYEKEEGADFALWKKSKEGEPAWDSPWGKGRPGWHIECSAMSMKYLGETFDLHAGGEDLIFPHHENEIAQSEAATGKPFVMFWLHAKHLLVNGEKMSKSKGNFYTLRDLLAKGYDPMAVRYALLSVHYRAPLNFTLEGLKEAGEVIKRLDDCYWRCLGRTCDRLPARILEIARSLEDDLNVSSALARLHEAVGEMNSAPPVSGRGESAGAVLHFFKQMDRLLGLDIAAVDSIPADISEMLRAQQEFRKNRSFGESDRLRQEMERKGWLVKDGRPGEPSTVKKKRRAWD